MTQFNTKHNYISNVTELSVSRTVIPVEQRLQAVRAAVCLLPDENRDALHTLLCFLSDVEANVSENQMTCTNLAVCLAPSLFHLNTTRRDASSPRCVCLRVRVCMCVRVCVGL